jgi:hypothetical protein
MNGLIITISGKRVELESFSGKDLGLYILTLVIDGARLVTVSLPTDRGLEAAVAAFNHALTKGAGDEIPRP